MKYGCIGERLGHSFSKEIHGLIADYEYELREIPRDSVGAFMEAKDFCGINVTIPYKETVMPYLDEIDDGARRIGSVNTVVNRGGRLLGYNTDFYGMSRLIKKCGIEISGKKVMILGSGGTSKTAHAVCESMGAGEIIPVSRSGRDGTVTYEDMYYYHTDADVIVNTTPVGMYPNVSDRSVDVSKFPRLFGYVDAIYNPLRPTAVREAVARGIAAEGGLYMLVAQAVRAAEIFMDTALPENTLDSVFERIVHNKENVVLIGMPSSGKSTVGKMVASLLGREFVDTDELIVKLGGMPIPEIFATRGEAYFRDLESEAVRIAAKETCRVIATGGGAVLRVENVDALKQNGRVFFIDRPLEKLITTSDRPLSSDRAALEQLYTKRYGIYCDSSDERIDGSPDVKDVAQSIMEHFKI